MFDLKKSAYFNSLPKPVQQSIMESKMQSGTGFENEDELRRFAAQYFPPSKNSR
ncbi:MAG: hypothetical protein VB051_09450 [Candidatus Pelethousia sp.]|nr:hypothetical protein [Candidatus Pelethousia sp.]